MNPEWAAKLKEKFLLSSLTREEKIALLRVLDYDSDGQFVLSKDGEFVVDEYIDQPVKIDNMLILEGSTLIIDNNPLSIAAYLEEHPDVGL